MSGESGESKLLTPSLRSKLEKIAKDEGFVNPSFVLGEGAASGEGFIGVVFRVSIEEQQKASDKPALPLVVKCLPLIKMTDHIFSIDTFFRMETMFYDKIQPAFNQFQKERGVTNFAPSSPRCYEAKQEIILADMRPQGYALKSGITYETDLPHCATVLRELGRFHAVSLAMKDQRPDLYRTLTRHLEEAFLVDKPSPLMIGRFDDAVRMAVVEFEKRATVEGKERYVEALERHADGYYDRLTTLIRAETAEPFSVVNHGDCWMNNALFKYDKPDKAVPSGLCLLDYQLVRNSTPALDVSYFIFMCTTKAMRDRHYKQMLSAYYDSLADFLKQLGSDPENVFPETAFQDQLKRFGKYALDMAIHETPLMTYNAADEPPATGESVVDPAFTLTHANSDTCWSRVTDVVVEMVQYGYIV